MENKLILLDALITTTNINQIINLTKEVIMLYTQTNYNIWFEATLSAIGTHKNESILESFNDKK